MGSIRKQNLAWLPAAVFTVFCLFLFAPNAYAQSLEQIPQEEIQSEWNRAHYIINYNALELARLRSDIPELQNFSDREIKDLLSEIIETDVVDSAPFIDALLIKAKSSDDVDVDMALNLLELGIAKYITPDHLQQAIAVPNDALFSSLWGMHQANDHDIDAPEAWDISTGNANDPVVVGVIDTGVDYNHADLHANMWENEAEKNGTPGVDDDANGIVDDIYGYNAIAETGDPLDDHKYSYSNGSLVVTNVYHGTHCSGTIGGVANNGIGVAGVAWNVKIMGLKFLNHYGSGSSFDAVQLIQYAVMMKLRGVNIRVLSNSWGGGGYSQALYDAISAANNAGIIFTAAAGNAGVNTDQTTYYPQGYNVPNVVSVAAMQSNGTLASFSNYGANSVDLAAPGVSILSTKGGASNAYQYLSGTSMATPHVSGIAAVAFSLDPTLTPAALRTKMMQTVQANSNFNGKMLAPGTINLNNLLLSTNHQPTIANISAQVIGKNTPSHMVPISVADADNNPLTVTAEVEIPATRVVAADADNMWQFASYNSALDNSLGLNEKHIFSATKEFIIFSDGEIYRSDPTYMWLRSAGVDPSYYLYPEKLITASPALASDYATFSVNQANTQLTIFPAPEYQGQFGVKVSVSDGHGSVYTNFNVQVVGNNAPALDPIDDQITSWQIPVTLDVEAIDPDGDEVSYSVTLYDSAATAYHLDRQYNFTSYNGLSQNYLGFQEKYIRAQNTNSVFFIKTDGALHRYDGASNPLVARLETSYYTTPTKFFDAVLPSNSYPGVAVLDGTLLRLDGQATYSGVFKVEVSARDALGAVDTEYFWLTLANAAPVLSAIPDKVVQRNAQSLTAPLSASDANSDLLLFTAKVLAPNEALANVAVNDQTLTITFNQALWSAFDVEVTVSDGEKTDKKTFRVSLVNNAPVLSAIADKSVHWKNSPLGITLSASDADGDVISYTASATKIGGGAFAGTLQISGNTLSINPPAAFVGGLVVEVLASDGLLTSKKTFQASFTNNAPTLAAIADQTTHSRTAALNVALSASDANNDALTLSAKLLAPANSGAQLSISGQTLTITFAQNYLGTFGVEVSATDGAETATRSFNVTRKNTAPVIVPIANKQVHWKAVPAVVSFVAADPEGDPLTLSAAADGFAGNVSIVGSTIAIDPPSNYTGTVNVVLTARDAYLTTNAAFQVTFFNQAPSIAAIADRTVGKLTDIVTIPISATDADNEQLTLGAKLVAPGNSGAVVSLNGTNLIVNFDDNFLGAVNVEVSASDGLATATKQFKVTRQNSTPVIDALTDQTIHWSNVPYQRAIHATDADEDDLELWASASLVGGGVFGGTVQIAGETLTVNPPESFVGAINLTVNASDGSVAASKTFKLTFANAKPVIAAIADQSVSKSKNSVDVAFSATDSDLDALSLTAKTIPANAPNGSVEIVGNTLRVAFAENFLGSFGVELSASDGAESVTKSFTVTRLNYAPVLQAITNRQVHWKAFPVSIALSAADVDEDTLTYSATATTANGQAYQGSVTIQGSILTIARATDFTGTINLNVSASDGAKSDSKAFTVTVTNSAPQIAAITNKTIHWKVGSATVPVTATDADGDELTTTVTAQDANGVNALSMVSFVNNVLTIAPPAKYLGVITITLRATDGFLSDEKSFNVTFSNNAPVFNALAARSVGKTVKSLDIPLGISDADQDDLTITAELAAPANSGASLSIANKTLNVGFTEGYLGTFVVNISATDGLADVSQSVSITRANIAPVLNQIANINLHWKEARKDIVLQASDADSDELTLAATATSNGNNFSEYLSLNGNTLSVVPPVAFVGEIKVHASASDGTETAARDFSVFFNNKKPTMAAIAQRKVNLDVLSIDIPVVASDADGDTLSYAAKLLCDGVSGVSATMNGAVLHVDFAAEFLRGCDIEVSATDGAEVAKQVASVTRKNFAPDLDAIGNKNFNWREAPVSIALTATDPNDDPLTYSATVKTGQEVAYALDQANDFFFYQSEYFNYYGKAEKHFRGNQGQIRYAIYPNGDLVKIISGDLRDAVVLGHVGKRYYADINKLFNVPAPQASDLATVSVTDNVLTITTPAKYVGALNVSARVSDGELTDSENFIVTLINSAPALAAVANKTVRKNITSVDVALNAADADNDPLSFSAEILSPANSGAQISFVGSTMTLAFAEGFLGAISVKATVTDGAESASQTFTVSRENIGPKIDSITDRQVQWRQMPYALSLNITDDDGDNVVVSATAKTQQEILYALDQAHNFALVGGYNENWHGQGERYVRGDNNSQWYFIKPSGDFYRYNGTNLADATFLARLTPRFHQDPTLLFDVPAPTVSAQASVNGDTLTISASSGFAGQILATVTASDGTLSDSKQFYLYVTNALPQFVGLNDITVGKKVASVDFALSATDADADPVTFGASLVQPAHSGVSLSQNGNIITVGFTERFSGPVEVSFSAFDGADTVTKKAKVIRTNTYPELAAISNKTVAWKNMPVTVAVVATDADEDPIALSATAKITATGVPVTATFNGSNLTITPPAKFVGGLDVTVTANDGEVSRKTTFLVTSTNSAPTIQPMPDLEVSKSAPTATVPLTIADADNDTLTISALVRSPSNSGSTLNVSANELVVNFQAGFIGTLVIEVSASDSVTTTKRLVNVSHVNLAPKLDSISDRTVHWKQMPLDVPLTATDPDGDALSYSASFITIADLAYSLDQAYNFYVDTGFEYNKNNEREKYLKGNYGARFFIYPDGKFYQQSGETLQGATYLGRLSAKYWEDPAQLINVRVPKGNSKVIVNIVGSTLKVSVLDGYLGNIIIKATASDGALSDTKTFNVLVENNAPVIERIANEVVQTGGATLSVPIIASDADHDELTLSATLERENQLAYDLDREHNFYFLRSYYFNARGGNEKYIRGNRGWYLILPNGDLYLWSGSSEPTGTFLATLDTAFYRDPSLLFDISEPIAGQDPATVALNGSFVDIQVRADVVGVFIVRVQADDGSVKSVERFSVTVSERTGAIDQNLDSDGDGVSDEDEINGGTDPFDSGSFIPSLRSPVYAVWNGFLAMTNILELVNPNDFAIRADVSLYAIDGKLKRVQPVMVPPMGQFDLILNNLPGFTADSYGVIKIEFEGILDGRMSFYRNSQVPGEFDFAYSIELSDPSRGETAVSFNTYQPSMNPAEARNQVANWLTVVNFANAAKSYRVKTFDQTGGLLADRMLRVPAFGRVDVDGGHVLVGPNVVGMHTITPSDPQAPYTAQLTRYAGNTDGSSLPTAYSFAFPLVARAGTGRELVMPVTRQFNESNWVELINTSNDSVRAHIRILDANGHELFSERTALRAHAQKHYDVSSRFAPGATGIALVTADTPNALIMQSMVYLRNSWGGVEAMYGSQGKEAIGHAVFGSYNRFLGMENWLKVVNYSASAAQIQLIVNSANSSKEEVFTLPAYGSTVLPIHNGARFGTVENSYGTVEVRGAGGVNFFAELLRLKRAGANPDFAAPTAVR